jgi:arylsulfatase A-like enzyme
MNGPPMNRRRFPTMLTGGAACLALCGAVAVRAEAQPRERPPNFIVVFTDDQGYGDVGCFGSQQIATPHLDRMAAEGVRLTDFYVAAPSCTPSRAALLTGCYPQRVGLPSVLFPNAKIGISSDEHTIAEILRRRGYATACYGKWHLGHHPEFLPTRHGFDDYFGLPYSNDMWPQHPEAPPGYYPDLPLVEGEKIVQYNPDQTRLTTWYTERALRFIEQHRDQPFFLYLPHSMPHVPLHVSEEFKGSSKGGMYGDVIEEIDGSVGQVLAALKRLGIDQHTMVIFTSDNGPWLRYGDHGGSAGPLREGKGTTFEGGQRVPCLMRWPGQIPAGSVCRGVATTMDILPTLVQLAGAELPARRIDGRDIWPMVSGRPGASSPHEAFFFYAGWNLQAVRSGRWKLHLPHRVRSFDEVGSGGIPGPLVLKETGQVLFDLESDIGEQHDVSAHHPDVVERLLALIDRMREDLGDSTKEMTGTNRRPPGEVESQDES